MSEPTLQLHLHKQPKHLKFFGRKTNFTLGIQTTISPLGLPPAKLQGRALKIKWAKMQKAKWKGATKFSGIRTWPVIFELYVNLRPSAPRSFARSRWICDEIFAVVCSSWPSWSFQIRKQDGIKSAGGKGEKLCNSQALVKQPVQRVVWKQTERRKTRA